MITIQKTLKNTEPWMMKAEKKHFKDTKDELFREEQQRKLWRVIVDTIREIAEPKQTFWINRMYRNYTRRFYYLMKCEWVPFLGELNDTQAYGHYRNRKARKYCMLIRDHACELKESAKVTDENERAAQL